MPTYSVSVFLMLALVVLSSTTVVVEGQPPAAVGTDLCACTPSTYEFTVDFSLTCPPVNVTLGEAIENTSCITSPYGNLNTPNLVPVVISRINILELGQRLFVVKQTTIEEELRNGDTLQYASITATPAEVTAVSDVPKALQINLEGRNAEGDKLINVLIISFSNGCGRNSYPVFEEGNSAGWLQFVSGSVRLFALFGGIDF